MWILLLFSSVWLSGAQVTLSPPPESAPLSAPSTCDRDMIRMNDRMFPRIQGVRDLCHQHPDVLVASLKLNLTRYLCLYHSDLECLRKTQTFLASYNQGNRRASDYAADFERIVGSRYINTWINDDPNKNYNHPALRNSVQDLGSVLDESLGAVSSVASLISKVVPYGNILDLAASGLGALTSMGRSETSPDPNNTCSTARDAYINATPEGRSCSPNFNFNSEPVARFLRQTPERQAQGLQCNDTCRYYAGLLTTLERTNAMINHFAMPIFESRPQCLSGGRVSFSFEALNSTGNRSPIGPPRIVTPMSWKGIVTTSVPTSRGERLASTYYRFQNEVTPPGDYLRWQVTGDMTMRNSISATVNPPYALGASTVQMTIPQISQNSHRTSPTSVAAGGTQYPIPGSSSLGGGRVPAGFSTPRWQAGPIPGAEVVGLHQLQDPAIQGMGLATAAVTGCCSVPNPNRDKCLDGLMTIENFRPRDEENPSAPATVNQ